MKRQSVIFSLLLLIACCVPAFAQAAPAPSVTVKPGEAIRLAWNYPAADLTVRPVQFRLYVDGVVSLNFKSSDIASTTDAAGQVTFTTNAGVVPSWTAAQRGTHLYELAAYDTEGESAKSGLSIGVGFGTPPNPPLQLRPYTVTGSVSANGEITLLLTPVAR